MGANLKFKLECVVSKKKVSFRGEGGEVYYPGDDNDDDKVLAEVKEYEVEKIVHSCKRSEQIDYLLKDCRKKLKGKINEKELKNLTRELKGIFSGKSELSPQSDDKANFRAKSEVSDEKFSALVNKSTIDLFLKYPSINLERVISIYDTAQRKYDLAVQEGGNLDDINSGLEQINKMLKSIGAIEECAKKYIEDEKPQIDNEYRIYSKLIRMEIVNIAAELENSLDLEKKLNNISLEDTIVDLHFSLAESLEESESLENDNQIILNIWDELHPEQKERWLALVEEVGVYDTPPPRDDDATPDINDLRKTLGERRDKREQVALSGDKEEEEGPPPTTSAAKIEAATQKNAHKKG